MVRWSTNNVQEAGQEGIKNWVYSLQWMWDFLVWPFMVYCKCSCDCYQVQVWDQYSEQLDFENVCLTVVVVSGDVCRPHCCWAVWHRSDTSKNGSSCSPSTRLLTWLSKMAWMEKLAKENKRIVSWDLTSLLRYIALPLNDVLQLTLYVL